MGPTQKETKLDTVSPRLPPVLGSSRSFLSLASRASPLVREFLGITFDNGDGFVGKVDVKEFKKGFKKIVVDIATGTIKSRDIYKRQDIPNYLKKFKVNEKPNLKKKGHFTPATLMTSTAYKSQEIATREPQRKPRRKTKPRGIVPSDFSCDLSNQRINYIFDELKKLPVAQYPNATAILLRGLLEMSLSYYLNRTGHLDKMIEAAKKKAEKKGQTFPKTFNPTHKQMLSYVVNSENSIIGNPKVIQALNKLLKENEKLFSLDTLNLFAHNEHFMPTEESLRRFWGQLAPLFEIILIEPEVN